MNKHRLLLLLGMFAGLVVFVTAVAGFVTNVGRLVSPTIAPTRVETPTATPGPAPVAITSAQVPILMYHHLKDHGADASRDFKQLSVPPAAFREQIAYLRDNGFETVTFAQLLGAFEGKNSLPARPVIITFDDGWDDIYHVAYPILRENGMTATFFISTNWLDNLGGTLSWAQVAELSRGGMEFGSHSVTHPYLTTSSAHLLRAELEASKAALEKHTGATITALAYPFGLYDERVIAAAEQAGYRTACTIDPGTTATAEGLMTLPRLWVYGWTTLDEFKALVE